MQKIQSYEGTITLGSTSSRASSYGVSGTISVYQNKVDFFNQTVADFLSECGVDAAYEARGESEAKFLWIYGVPFLFTPISSSSSSNANGAFNLFYPYNSTAAVTRSKDIFSSYNSANYSFSLIFTGNPKTGFSLRYTVSGETTPTATSIVLKCMRTVNKINQKNGLAWFADAGNSVSSGSVNGYYFLTNVHVADVNSDNVIAGDNYSTALSLCPYHSAFRVKDQVLFPDKIPLVPMKIGEIWESPGVYRYPKNYTLPEPMAYNVLLQTEAEIDGRRFIIMGKDSCSSSNINIPLIEVTGEEE